MSLNLDLFWSFSLSCCYALHCYGGGRGRGDSGERAHYICYTDSVQNGYEEVKRTVLSSKRYGVASWAQKPRHVAWSINRGASCADSPPPPCGRHGGSGGGGSGGSRGQPRQTELRPGEGGGFHIFLLFSCLFSILGSG